MAVLVEAISVIVRRPAIAERFKGGWPAFQRAIPNATGCNDDDLARVGFMTPADVRAFVSMLEAGGLIFRRDGQAVDIAVVDQLRGPTVPAPWLEVAKVDLFEPKLKVTACLLAGQKLDGIAMPAGWTFEGSLSDRPIFVAEGTEGDRLKFLRHEDGSDVYLDLISGKEVFVGRPVVKGDSEAALFTQLQKICHDALNLEAKSEPLKALGDAESAAPLFERLQEELLPETERIAIGPGRNMAFAHFACGLVLRILKRLSEAEAAFRKANELQPGVINTLREIVRCLGEQGKHGEALPFAREATEVGPVDAGAWGNLAICLIQCGERVEARKAINFAIDLDPHDPLNRYIRDNFESYFKKWTLPPFNASPASTSGSTPRWMR